MTRRKGIVLAAVALVALAALAAGLVRASLDRESRQEQVAERGREVMSFDLERTTHIFRTLPDGGVQEVVADDESDSAEVLKIRSHLRKEAEAFERGDFHDPAAIHGEDMAGLHELMQGADEMDVTYEPIAAGGRITYVTDDPRLVEALHDWFRAQVADHGEHAEGDV